MGKKKMKSSENPSEKQDQDVIETNDEKPKPKSKKEKRKTPSDPSSDEVLNDGSAPKQPKLDEASNITAGTTIDKALLVNPALKLNKKTKRAKKREKHAKNVDEQKQKAKNREKEECRQYLQTWNDSREKWKFQKIKQVYIQKHVFDEDHLDGDMWPVVLEYLSGTKGPGRENLTKRAEEVIRELDRQAKDSGDDSLLEGSKYQRARELLQHLG
ncbi:AAEL009356-PA [Aedes aegypti]|uniref:AAEL009356-PA n=1 Tax=Aedes aegypti TaxID=7159 RepID=Q16W34_AEDAE|nr:AAEL009356-PA [Aedes aegypti]